MRTFDDFETQRDSLNRARLFTYKAKAIAAAPDEPFERRAHFETMTPAHFKAAIPAGVFDPLAPSSFGREFLALSKRSRILPQLSGAVELLPFAPTPVVSTTGGVSFTPEGSSLPAQRFDIAHVYGQPSRLGAIAVITNELARATDEKAVSTVERVLNQVLVQGENAAFLSTVARVAGVTPGGILAGVTPASGTDVWELWSLVSGGSPLRPYFITSSRVAMYLLSQATPGSIFSTLNASAGGTIGGVPTVLAAEAENKLILLDATRLGVLDEGLDVQASQAGTLEMSDTPVAGATAQVSMFQSNSVALRLVRLVDWILATDDAVAYLEVPIAGSPA